MEIVLRSDSDDIVCVSMPKVREVERIGLEEGRGSTGWEKFASGRDCTDNMQNNN